MAYNIQLTIAVDKIDTVNCNEILIPKGSEGRLVDVIIQNGEAMFLLEFLDVDTIVWYEINELEEKF